jgi:hypothetical protein
VFGALKALSNSEKAVAVGALVLAATVMVFTGHLTVDQWIEYTEWMAVIYVGGKTVQGAVSTMAAKRAPRAPDDPT